MCRTKQVGIWSEMKFHNCHYTILQAMIHELIGISNNTVNLEGRQDVPDEMKKMTLSADLDEFYRLNMYVNFGEIGSTIQNLVKSFQEKVKNQQKLDSINDIKDFVTRHVQMFLLF